MTAPTTDRSRPRRLARRAATPLGTLVLAAVAAAARGGLVRCHGLAAGAALRLADRRRRVERWLVAPPTGPTRLGWDRGLSGPFLGVTAIVGLIAFGVVGTFVYYPDRSLCVDRMRSLVADTAAATADTVREGQIDEAIRYLEQWELLARQMQVGVYLRTLTVTPDQANTVDDLREAIEAVRDDLRAGNVDAADRRFDRIAFRGKYRACLACYAPSPTRPARATRDHNVEISPPLQLQAGNKDANG